MRKSALVIGTIFICLVLAVNVTLANQDFYGNVQQMPESGFVGEWVVGGRTVTATNNTEFKEKHGKLQIGAYVEVEGRQKAGKFIASEIETKVKK